MSEATYKNANGTGSYEALVITKNSTSQAGKELKENSENERDNKKFSISIPVRLLPLLEPALQFIKKSRDE